MSRAEAYFGEAIMLDPEAPLPRLGLGLAYIRQGDTAAGAWEIERAVAHDPRRASLRTWLGRAYFEEGLAAKAAEELRISIAEDPQDPTPYLFSALQLYAANRPIPALRQLQEAERQGSARSVLRSERGLAEDTATRGAAIGRIYDVLGFEQLAINEGAAATTVDPANPGAHRFLASALRQRPGNEVAQTSELLRSQLLSPPSKTPIQPELSESRTRPSRHYWPLPCDFRGIRPAIRFRRSADRRFRANGNAGHLGRSDCSHWPLPKCLSQPRAVPL